MGGSVSNEELYRLLYEHVDDSAGVAILLIQQKLKDNDKPRPSKQSAEKSEKNGHQVKRIETREDKKSTAQQRAFEERCGCCKKQITLKKLEAESNDCTDATRMWVRSYNSPKYLISFAATFLIDRVLKGNGSAVHLYFVSNDNQGGVQQLMRHLKSMARVLPATVTQSTRPGDNQKVEIDEYERVNLYQLRVDHAGMWAKRKHAERLRDLAVVTTTRVNETTNQAKPSTVSRGDTRWERLSSFAFFSPKPEGEHEVNDVKLGTKEKDIDVLVRRVKYNLWMEHERGIVLPRTRHDLRKRLRPSCTIEKRLDPLEIFKLIEASNLIRVCRICNEFTYTFERYHEVLHKKKEAKNLQMAATNAPIGVDSYRAEDISSEEGDGSELCDSGSGFESRKRAKRGQCITKESRTRRVAQTIIQNLLKAKNDQRPKTRSALLNHIDGQASYKSHLDADLVVSKLISSGFVLCESKNSPATGDAAPAGNSYYFPSASSSLLGSSGREDVAVEYTFCMSDADKLLSEREEAARIEKRRQTEADLNREQIKSPTDRTKRSKRLFDNIDNLKLERPTPDIWGAQATVTEPELEDQRRSIARIMSKGANAQAGAYIGYMAKEMSKEEHTYNNEVHDDIDKYGLKDELLRGFYAYGFEQATILQRKAYDVLTAKRDALLLGVSGTGKTTAYVLPLLSMIDTARLEPQAIVMLPTRPLAQQVQHLISALGEYLNVKCALIVGGDAVRQCMQAVKDCHVVVGTAGRIYDMIKRSALAPESLKLLVVDEIDDMLSQTKRDAIYDVFQTLPRDIQVCAVDTVISQDSFSVLMKAVRNAAIITDDVVLSSPYPRDVTHYTVRVGAEQWKLITLMELLGYGTSDPVERDYLIRAAGLKREDDESDSQHDIAIVGALQEGGIDGMAQMVIFCNSKRKVDWLTDRASQLSFPVVGLHEDLDPESLKAGILAWRTGETRIIITTDSLSFGLDVCQVNCVINYDVPSSAKSYLRRVGRAGRYGRRGAAITLLVDEDQTHFEQIQKALPFECDPLPANLSL